MKFLRKIKEKSGLSFLIIILLTFFAGAVYGQTNRRVSIKLQDEPIQQFFDEVNRQTGIKFLYSESIVNTAVKITIDRQDTSLDQVLETVSRQTGLKFLYENNTITVSDSPAVSSSANTSQPAAVVRQMISGKVVDENGEGVIGANVVEKNTTNGVVTDIDGNFSIQVPGNSTLQISYIGYIQQDVPVRNRTLINIQLKEDAQNLDEVVVVGYGVMRKRDLTGAISTVKSADMNLTGVSSVGHALAGKAAGMYVRQNSAQPGGGLDILIRGKTSVNASNEPLYVVDGFPIAVLDQPESGDRKMDAGTQSPLNFLNPNDIESIEVLKDASSTAIYGARAANGVVLITTKRGREGKAKVSYSMNYSYQKYADTYDLLSLGEWMDQKNKSTWEQWVYDNRVAPWGTRRLEEAIKSPVNGLAYTRPYTEAEIANAGAGTDWLGLITRDGQIMEHNVTLEGGQPGNQLPCFLQLL